ncbi:MAG: hypothetical protein HC861_06580, partial [Rhodospirillaceae bacterium]|nr:hypothetical protein [Rhodospirillaceae bacterium]
WQVSKTTRRIMLGDKLGMNRICEENGIATVPILVVAEDGNLEYRCDRPAGLERDLLLKPRQSKGSRGIEVIRYSDGKYLCENGATLDHDGLIALVARRSKDAPILVQPLIRNHPGLADLAEQALMRMRVITCLDQGGNPVLTHAVLSNLCKLETSWPTDIELGAAVDLESGALGMMTGDKADAWLDWSEDHPITHARVLGRIVPCWDDIRAIALAAHAAAGIAPWSGGTSRSARTAPCCSKATPIRTSISCSARTNARPVTARSAPCSMRAWSTWSAGWRPGRCAARWTTTEAVGRSWRLSLGVK